jgi:hypothetical protein
MPYVYNADMWCSSCGDRLERKLEADGVIDDHDSDTFPQYVPDPGESDSPYHCAAGSDCLEALDLQPYGARADALRGAESVRVGALVTDSLTDAGVEYVREILAEPDPTPYQSAIHAYWREAFSDQL